MNQVASEINEYQNYVNQLETELNLYRKGTKDDKDREIDTLKKQVLLLQEELVKYSENI